MENRIIDTTQAWEGRKHMPFLSNVERRGLKRGHDKGLEEGQKIGERRGLLEAIALGLELRFGVGALELLPRVREVQEVDGKLQNVIIHQIPDVKDPLHGAGG